MDNQIPGTGRIIATQIIKEHLEFKSTLSFFLPANRGIISFNKKYVPVF